jgi:hypothetical protein
MCRRRVWVSENFLVESECFFTKLDLSLPSTIYIESNTGKTYIQWIVYFKKEKHGELGAGGGGSW